jgi:hypothetical protein
MAINLDGFVTPEQNFGGLYKAADTLERNRYRDEQLAERREAKRAATGKFLESYLDPKEHLSGSPYDPKIATDLMDVLSEGASLADKGADSNMIMMALAPKIKGVIDYSEKAKLIKAQKDKSLEMIKNVKGIDPKKFSAAFDEMAFYDVDETGQRKLKDVKDIDPNKVYGDVVLENGDIFTNEGIGDFVKTSGKETRNSDYRYYNRLGSLNRTKAAYTAPSFMQPEEDERGAFKEFVPQYDVATDAGLPKELDFHSENGSTKAPVRMVTDNVFNSLPPAAKGYLRQEARKYAKEHGVALSSPQAYNFAKAIAYDELKESGKLSSSVSELVDNKPSTFQIKIDNGIPLVRQSSGGGSGSDSDATFNNIYWRIKEKGTQRAKDYADGKFISNALTASDLAQDELAAVLQATSRKDLEPEDIKVIVEESGRVGVYNKGTGERLVYLNQTGTNLSKQSDVKGRRTSVKEGNENYAPVAAPTKSTKKKISW